MRHIALVTDSAYAPWCSTAIRSIVRDGGDDATTVHVLHDGTLDAADRALLTDAALGTIEVRIHDVGGEATRHLPALGRFGTIVWLRFLLPTLLPEVDRLLYLDADVLVTSDLSDCFDTPLDDAPIAAVRNVLPAVEWTRVAALGLIDPSEYFNSGVLLMNLEQLRREHLLERCADVTAAMGPRIVWPDQDVLNVLFSGRWRALPARTNAQQSFFVWPELAKAVIGDDEWRAAVDDPAIVHFEGPDINKPWNAWSTHPYRDRYREIMAELDSPRAVVEGDGPVSTATRFVSSDLRFRAFKTARSLRRDPRRELGRRARSVKARLGSGEPPNESWLPPDHAARLRPSRQAPHPLSTASETHRSIVMQCRPYTMVTEERLLATIDGVERAIATDIPGAFMECGVWRGGSTLAMALTLLANGVDDRDIWLYDTFEGMTEPTAADTSRFDGQATEVWDRSNRSGERMFGETFANESFGVGQVRRLLASSGYPSDRLHFVAGPVEETIPQQAPDNVALMRLDTDWYESTRHELEHLYPRLATGGVLIIDDYGHWDGARAAVDEYFATTPRPFLTRSDYSGRIGLKQ